ncbi:MAG: carbamoyl-phosphate synthase large subunit [Thermoanaerobaculia bacterium]|nr:carbamoyl-phosphate synthase large subunit [Thermoanaerobaculia bacterium]
MPKRSDLKTILVLGSGPIVIGQACEFDYSGTQACRVLRREGYRVVLVNSNPATIMTDPEFADATYVEPLELETVSRVIERERPDALLPTVGGQTALNLAIALEEAGILKRLGVELLGASAASVRLGEDRLLFKEAMVKAGLSVLRSGLARSLEDARRIAQPFGFPVIVRPSFTLGGTGGGIAFNAEDFEGIVKRGLQLSPVHEVLVEESALGWKEFELEVMRDAADTCVIVCSIENVDPMGVHTGDSITVAPQMTLSDVEYQAMRDDAKTVIRTVGVATGGSNIQFAVHPGTGRRVVIEMNPRVSRSSALASKATGFPIAKIAALLAIGYRLDELPNDITKKTPASFEPSLDYVVVKIPRFNFEKFPSATSVLGVQMKSVGEVMALGRTFHEAFGKALRSLENGQTGWLPQPALVPAWPSVPMPRAELLRVPRPDRIFHVMNALRAGATPEDVHDISAIDRWFLDRFAEVVEMERTLRDLAKAGLGAEPSPSETATVRRAKRLGFSDADLSRLLNEPEEVVRQRRQEAGVDPVFSQVDTCAAEFESSTPYLYSCFETEDDAPPSGKETVIVLGSGPNRIGQGLEFDYCCVHAAKALSEAGYESIMVNCNPETVSTDYDTSDRLYFEPLTFEDVLAVVRKEKPHGVLVQFGGQTPLKLAHPLQRAGVRILGTPPEAIDTAEDRERFGALLRKLDLAAPPWSTARDVSEGVKEARRIGFPLLVRPSYVLGGRAMRIVYEESELEKVLAEALEAFPGRPVLIDQFLEDAFELDVDALGDGTSIVIAGIMQHIEEAGIHSGDSYAVIPPYRKVPREALGAVRAATKKLGEALGVTGLMNVQFAIRDGNVFVLEVNPRASRTVPFVSKATGVPLARLAARLCLGESLESIGLTGEPVASGFSIKAPVFPFRKFEGTDTLLGPEMRSTGEVMGRDRSFGAAFQKAALGAGIRLPLTGTAFLSVHDGDKPALVPVARELSHLGFALTASLGTARSLKAAGLPVDVTFKVNEGRPNVVDRMINGEIQLVVNTPLGRDSFFDELAIRRTALERDIPCLTTLSAAAAAVEAIKESASASGPSVHPLQEALP